MAGSKISIVTREGVKVRGRDLPGELVGNLSFIDMFLLQLRGRHPSPLERKLVEAVMVTIMEHGLVPSVLAARLTLGGAPESFQGAVAAGLLGVGDRYAGTASECGKLLAEIVAAPPADRDDVAARIVAEHRAARRPLPGFGHPDHKDGDPRYHRLIAVGRELGAEGSYLDACETLGTALCTAAGKTIPTNVSLGIAALLAEAGLPADMFRGVVLIARCAGLVGHIAEEIMDPSADLIWKSAEHAMAQAIE